MSEPILLVVDRKEGCECYFARVDNEPGPRLMHTVVERLGDSEWIGLEDCPHGSTVRLATAEDIPADMAAEALGVNAISFDAAAEEVGSPYCASLHAEAARRAREAEQVKTAKGGS